MNKFRRKKFAHIDQIKRLQRKSKWKNSAKKIQEKGCKENQGKKIAKKNRIKSCKENPGKNALRNQIK